MGIVQVQVGVGASVTGPLICGRLRGRAGGGSLAAGGSRGEGGGKRGKGRGGWCKPKRAGCK